eukprot:TRINITY_DN4008_c0_g1_i1.p1 TRINITY_DN4008_c0_g1~~TRINITY_DN4008_c0_g1_i1.p1  ORF type:complete len:155 (+),score=26.73 TRINITY_DN4008_c0_g1_i1:98-562(+)
MTSIDEKTLEAFDGVKKMKLRWCTWKIVDYKIVGDQTGDRKTNLNDFIKAMPATECRYGAYDLEFQTTDGRKSSKILFISWTPANSSSTNRVIYAQAKPGLVGKLTGITTHESRKADDIKELLKIECIGGTHTLPQTKKKEEDETEAEPEDEFD